MLKWRNKILNSSINSKKVLRKRGVPPKTLGIIIKSCGLPNNSSFKISSSPKLPAEKSLTSTLSIALLLSTQTPLNFPVAFAVNVIIFPIGGSRTQSQKNIVDCDGERATGPPKIKFGVA